MNMITREETRKIKTLTQRLANAAKQTDVRCISGHDPTIVELVRQTKLTMEVLNGITEQLHKIRRADTNSKAERQSAARA